MKNAGGWREPRHLRRELPTWHVSRASRVALPRLPQPGDERNQFPQIPSQKIWTDKDPSRLACSEDIIPKVTRSIFCRLKGKYTSERGACLVWWRGLQTRFLTMLMEKCMVQAYVYPDLDFEKLCFDHFLRSGGLANSI